MKLSRLLSMLMYQVDKIEYYNENMIFLYSFPISEVPENCGDKILKFNIYEKEGKTNIIILFGGLNNENL